MSIQLNSTQKEIQTQLKPIILFRFEKIKAQRDEKNKLIVSAYSQINLLLNLKF